MYRARTCLITIVLLSWPLDARAEMPPQNRDEAPAALTGTVEYISEYWESEKSTYQIFVRVDQVDHGELIRPGELFEVSCFRRPWSAARKPTAMGHSSRPEIGDKIHLFAWPRRSGYEGNYPQWYDLIEPSRKSWIARQYGYRNVRIAFAIIVIAISMLGVAIWRWIARLKRGGQVSRAITKM